MSEKETPEPERAVASWKAGIVHVAVTNRARVVIETLSDVQRMWISDPAKIAELQDVLEHARVEQARVARKLYPSAVRREIALQLQAGPKALGDLIVAIGPTTASAVEIRSELKAMTADGTATIQPPSGPDGLAKYRLAV
jgi:uncharacterized protein (DUF2236 family)